MTLNKKANSAFLFPGQGAQVVGMGKQIYSESREGKAIFDEIDSALNRSLSRIMFEGPEDELRETVNAQPAIMAVSLACLAVMTKELGEDLPKPIMMAGHSLGEYTALVASSVLSIDDGVLLVQQRGKLMQEACDLTPGTMAAILGLDETTMLEIAEETGTYVSNINTQEQIVISGSIDLVPKAMNMATEHGAKRVIPLNVGGAFHSGLMESAKEGLTDAVNSMRFNNPSVPIIANCTGSPLVDGEEIKLELITQISGCVNWKKTIDYMTSADINNYYEIGPGRALSGMIRKINSDAVVTNINDIESVLAIK